MLSDIDDAPCRDRSHEQNRKHDYRRKRLLVIGAPLPNSAGLRRLRRCRFPIHRIIRKLNLDLFLLFLAQYSLNSAFTQPPSNTDRMPKSYSHLASSKTHSKRNSTAGHDKRPITYKGGQRPTPNYHNGKHRERHIELQDEHLRKTASDAPRSQANSHNASQLLPVYPTFALTIRPLELASE